MESLSLSDSIESSTDMFQAKKTQFIAEIRQKQRDDVLTKKRLKFVLKMSMIPEEKSSAKNLREPKEILVDFFKSIQERDLELAEQATAEIKDSIARPKSSFNQICDLFMESGVILHLIGTISDKYSNCPKLQENASWALCNFTAGDSRYVEYAINNHILDRLTDALDFASGALLENYLWTLANLIGDNSFVRDAILTKNVIEKITKIIFLNQDKMQILRTAIWLLSNVTRDCHASLLSKLLKTLPLIVELISLGDDIITEHILWTFCNFCEDLDPEKINFTASDTGIIEKTIPFLAQTTKTRIKLLTFRLFSYFATSNRKYAELLINKGYIEVLERYLSDPSSLRRKETCKTLKNLISCYPEALENLNDIDITSRLVWILLEDSTDTRVEAVKSILSIVCNCNEDDLPTILSAEILAAVIKNIESSNLELCVSSLETLFEIFKRSEKYCGSFPNPIYDKFRELNVINVVEQFSLHDCDQISSRSSKILDSFLKTPN